MRSQDFYRRLATARDDLNESMVLERTMLLSSLFQASIVLGKYEFLYCSVFALGIS